MAWTSNLDASFRVQAGRKQLPSGLGTEGKEKPIWATFYITGKQRRKYSRDGFKGGMLAEHKLRVSSQNQMTNVAPGSRVRAV